MQITCSRANKEVIEKALLAGNEEALFAHATSCRDCRVALIQNWASPPGCTEALTGYHVLLLLDVFVEGRDRDLPARILEHIIECQACIDEITRAKKAKGKKTP